MRRLVSEAQLYRRVVLGDVLDDSRSATITLYPKMAIVDFYAPPSAKPGDLIQLWVSYRNDGGEGIAWLKVIDVDTNEEVYPRASWTAPAGATVYRMTIDLTMPNKTWNLRLEIGHWQPEV